MHWIQKRVCHSYATHRSDNSIKSVAEYAITHLGYLSGALLSKLVQMVGMLGCIVGQPIARQLVLMFGAGSDALLRNFLPMGILSP